MTADRAAHDAATRVLLPILTRWQAPQPAILAAELATALDGHQLLRPPRTTPTDGRDDWQPGHQPRRGDYTTGAETARAALRKDRP